MIRSLSLSAAFLLLPACSGDGPPAGAASDRRDGADTLDLIQREVYEREIVFMALLEDSMLITPWLFRSATGAEGVDREARALLSRGGSWEPFLQVRWNGPPTRSPWRLLPRAPLRLVVGGDDALERLVFHEGSRELELFFGEPLTEWGGQRGEVFRLQDGTILLSNQQLDGVLLDIARARRAEDSPAGDWAFLTSTSGFQFVLEDPGGSDGGADRFRAWTRTGFREVQWPRVEVEWTEARAFERARRDVPWGWSFVSSDQELSGELTVRAAHLATGEGTGPLLPVDAFYEVRGRIVVAGTAHSVRGVFRHVQR